MALTYQDISSYTTNYIVPLTTDTIFLQSPGWVRLQSKGVRDKFKIGGLAIQRPIMIGRLNAQPLAKGESFPIDFVQTDTALVENLKVYMAQITLYRMDAILNVGPATVFSQVEQKFVNASLRLAEIMATDMYADGVADARRMTGLPRWVDDGNTYTTVGGITRSDILAAGTIGGMNAYAVSLGAAFTLRALNTAYGKAWFGPDHPDLILVTQNCYDLIWEALQPLQRYASESGQSDVGKVGFQTLRFNAADVVVDKYLPTGSSGVAYGLNTNYIEFYSTLEPLFDYGFTGFKEDRSSIDVSGQFLATHQLVMPNPRTSFKMLSTLF